MTHWQGKGNMRRHATIVKVCGMRDGDNIRMVEQAHPDMMGFVCWQGSRRNVTTRPTHLPACLRVGVFVNPTLQQVVDAGKMLRLDYIQLHGNETPALCSVIKHATGLRLIKAISVDDAADIDKANSFRDVADMLLFDTKCKCMGGSGTQFDWDILGSYHGPLPFLLSGGIGPGDEERVRRWNHPLCLGVDINSRFETSPASKDAEEVKKFISKIKEQ